MIIKNILCYYKRTIKIGILLFSIIFLVSTFFMVFIGYQNIYKAFDEIEYGEYVIETKEPISVENSAVIEKVYYGEISLDDYHYIDDEIIHYFRFNVHGYAIDFSHKPSFLSDLENYIICGSLPNEKEFLIDERLAFVYSFILEIDQEDLIGKKISLSKNVGESYYLDDIYISGIVSKEAFSNDYFQKDYYVITDIGFAEEEQYYDEGRTYKNVIMKYSSIYDILNYLKDNNIEYWFRNSYRFNYNFLVMAQFELVISILLVLSLLVIFICFINLVTMIDFKAMDQERYFRMLRKIGYSSRKCKLMFIFENFIIYSVVFVIGYLISHGFVTLVNNKIIGDKKIFIILTSPQHFILAVLCFGIVFGILALISYFKVRNRFTKANS